MPKEREVMALDSEAMILRYEENVDYGKTAYFKDPSGYHSFVIWEFQAKK